MADTIIETYEPFSNQIAFHSAPQRNKLYGGSMGGGKSRTLCEEIVQLMIDYPGNRGFIGRKHYSDFRISTYLTLSEKVMQKYIDAGLVKENKSEHLYTFWNGSKLFYGGVVASGKNNQKLFSAEFGAIAIDEVFEITEDEFKAIGTRLRHSLPNGKHPNYYFLMATNPCQNWVKKRFILAPSSQDVFIPALPKDNPHNPSDYVDQLYDLFRGDKKMVAAFIEGSWDSIGDPDQLVTMDEIQKCINLPLNVEHGKIKRFISNDSGGMGDDLNVIYNWETAHYLDKTYYKITNVETTQAKEHHETVNRLLYLREMAKSNAIAIDPIGEGAGNASRLRELARQQKENGLEGFDVIDVDFRCTAFEPERYVNIRAEAYWMLKTAIQEKRICLPDEPKLHAQLCAIKWKPVGSTKGVKIQIIGKDEIKADLGESPDYSDNAAIGVHAEQCVRVYKTVTNDIYTYKRKRSNTKSWMAA